MGGATRTPLIARILEERTGLSGQITIQNACKTYGPEELAAARKRLEDLHRSAAAGGIESGEERADEEALVLNAEGVAELAGEDAPSFGIETIAPEDPGWRRAAEEAHALLGRSRKHLPTMHEEDREEAIDLNERIEAALADEDAETLRPALTDLRELLFFIEGK